MNNSIAFEFVNAVTLCCQQDDVKYIFIVNKELIDKHGGQKEYLIQLHQ